MKKFFLSLLLWVLFFIGFSSADTFEFSSVAWVPNYGNVNNANFYFWIVGYTWSSIDLHSVYLYDNSGYNSDCLGWILYWYGSSTILKRWSVSNPFSWETIIDYSVKPWVYSIRFVTTTWWTTTCQPGILYNSSSFYYNSFFAILWDTSTNVYNGASMHGSHGPIDKRVFSWNNPMVYQSVPYTITTPYWTTNIDQDITFTWDVSRESWYPDYLVSSLAVPSVVYRDWALFWYTGSMFNITDVDNVVVSWWVLEIYPNSSVPIPNVFLTGFSYTGEFLTTSWNLFSNFTSNLTDLFLSNIPAILVCVSIFLVILFLIRIIKPRKKHLPF